MKNLQIVLFAFLMVLTSCRQDLSERTSWHVYKADAASTSYSDLDQIQRGNVQDLEVAWVFQPDDAPAGSSFGKYECNPIVIDGVMYATSAQRWLYAIDAGTGEELWSFDPFDGRRGGGMCRGVTYWEDGADRRILFTAENFIYAVRASDGSQIMDFGLEGRVNLHENLGRDPDSVRVTPTSPGIIYKDLFIIGGAVSESYGASPGDVRAYDVRTGAWVWSFHTIPHPGEEGYETWPPDAWKKIGGANNWMGMSLDENRGIVYAPLGSPSYDYYGGDRSGKNLFGNSLVALDASTGEKLWHFQSVHHDLWDYDLPAPPTLLQVQRDGKVLDAVALSTKTGFMFVFDRVTGEPLFDIEERTVPGSQIEGEESWPTQPFPVKPKPYARQSMTTEEVTHRTEEARSHVLDQMQRIHHEGLFTPPGPQNTLLIPGSRGGGEYGGMACDPQDGIVYINSNESPEIANVQKVESGQNRGLSRYERGAAFYDSYCAACHGPDRKGQLPLYPPLDDVSTRLSYEDLFAKIDQGYGRMPSFGHLPEQQIRAIITFLLSEENQTERTVHMEDPVDEGTPVVFHNITGHSYFRDPDGYPAIEPPWGTLHAIDLNTGDYKWSVPLGDHPQARKADDPPTGSENYGGPISTAGGLIFIAATFDEKFRAFDKDTGEMLWEYSLPGGGFTAPATYSLDGRQFVVISVSGDTERPDGSIMAFALPAEAIN